MNIRQQIANDLKIPSSLITEALSISRLQVKKFRIRKRSSGTREIFQPSKKLKVLQYWLMRNVLDHLPVHDCATAYRPGASTLMNAQAHRANRFFLKMDLENFFPCIRYEDLIPIIRRWHQAEDPHWALDSDGEEIIRLACFYKQDRLAVGYPSSPVISNAVMYSFDERVMALVSSGSYGKVAYTRYADDLAFSTDMQGACSRLKTDVAAHIAAHSSPNIKVNPSKTKLGSSSSGSALVTGLRVCNDGHITLVRKHKDHIRLLLSLYARGRLDSVEQHQLRGHLAYCRHVAPAFYSALSRKFFAEISQLRNEKADFGQ